MSWLPHKPAPKPVPTPLVSKLSHDKILTYFAWLGELDAFCQNARHDEPLIDWQGIQINLEEIRRYLNNFMDEAK